MNSFHHIVSFGWLYQSSQHQRLRASNKKNPQILITKNPIHCISKVVKEGNSRDCRWKEVALGLLFWNLQTISLVCLGTWSYECQEAWPPKGNTQLPHSTCDTGILHFPLWSVQTRPSGAPAFLVFFVGSFLQCLHILAADKLIRSGLLQPPSF